MAEQGKVNCKSEAEMLLLVEGANDCHSIFQLMWLIYKTDPVFGINECGGAIGALDKLSSKLVSSHLRQKVIGLILDSDSDDVSPEQVVRSRLDQLRARLSSYYDIPGIFPEQGLILEPRDADRQPRVGVWLMPNNKAYGMFEDLLLESLLEEVRIYTAAVVNQAKTDGIALFKDTHLSKAVIRTYMAWQDPPDIQYLGLAIKTGTFKNIETTCARFIQWLEQLFGFPGKP